MKRDFRLYGIYFVSLLVGVVIYFTFAAFMFNPDILAALSNKEILQTGAAITSIVVFLFIIFFILYANSFFMKQRKKEFGMYLLYGMSEWQIAGMVLIETVCLSAVSLTGGIIAGGLLSKFFGMLLMRLMQYEQVISFSFPVEAVGSTVVLFLILIVMTSVQSYFSVRRVQLVELFHAKAKMDRPLSFSAGLAGCAIVLLGLGYFLISQAGDSVYWSRHFTISFIATIVGIIGGTYLFFRQSFGWVLERISRRKTYVEGSQMLWVSSLRFSVRGNTTNLTFISLFSALIIFLVGFVAINYAVHFVSAGQEFPNHLAFTSQDEPTRNQIERMIEEDHHRVLYHKEIQGLRTEPVAGREAAFGERYEASVLLFAASQYNEIVSLRGDDQQVNVQGQEAVALARGGASANGDAGGNPPHFTVKLKEETTFDVIGKKDYVLLGKATEASGDIGKMPAVLIISDEAFARLQPGQVLASFDIYQIDKAAKSVALSRKIHDIVVTSPETYYSAFVDLYTIDIEGSSLLLFSVAFLAVIALFAMGSIIYFKQLREATEEQRHYAILRQIGVSDGLLKGVIRTQLLFVFLPPLLLGLLHSWFLLHYLAMAEVRGFPQLTSMIATVLALYFVIYFLFYASSTRVYYKIVNPKTVMN